MAAAVTREARVACWLAVFGEVAGTQRRWHGVKHAEAHAARVDASLRHEKQADREVAKFSGRRPRTSYGNSARLVACSAPASAALIASRMSCRNVQKVKSQRSRSTDAKVASLFGTLSSHALRRRTNARVLRPRFNVTGFGTRAYRTAFMLRGYCGGTARWSGVLPGPRSGSSTPRNTRFASQTRVLRLNTAARLAYPRLTISNSGARRPECERHRQHDKAPLRRAQFVFVPVPHEAHGILAAVQLRSEAVRPPYPRPALKRLA